MTREKLQFALAKLRARGSDTLQVKEQNPSDHFHWSRTVFEVEAGELADALQLALAMTDAIEATKRGGGQ